MKTPRTSGVFSVLALVTAINAAELPRQLILESAAPDLRIRLSNQPLPPVGGTRFKLNLETSVDLTNWLSQGQLESSGAVPQLTIKSAGSQQFYRLRSEIEDTGTVPDGADLFGYNRVFAKELEAVGFLKSEDFAATNQPSQDYLDGLSFDPTTAKFWDAFAADPAVSKRPYDFRLNDAELGVLKANGFVVSERLGSYSFADVFYRLLSDDLPVYVSADAVLQAWHFTYERLLEESEETQLAPALQQILDALHQQLAVVPEAVRSGPLQESLKDADFYLAVARSLMSGQQVPSLFGADAAVADALARVEKLDFVDFTMFGTNRPFDFSQFTVRGHYDRSVNLARYFRAFMWTARVDFRMLTAKPEPQSLRELGTALVLCHLLQTSGQAERWQQLDRVIRVFVGRTDAMTFTQLQPLLEAGGITSLEAVTSVDSVADLQKKVVEGSLGVQSMVGDVYFSPFGPEQLQLPRAFVLTGQRFNPDGWGLGQVIFDRILWNEEIPGYTFFGKVIRRYCSALDMAYSTLGNRQIGWLIGQRMLDSASRGNFRDGLPYAHNLTALARTFDRIPAEAWEDSIYSRWLAALRTLSAPTTSSEFPEAMRTRAWSMRVLNTQLASYTQLKHDTVLYAKQPYTANILCEYPTGFVEPVPLFWRKMRELAESTATNLAALPASGSIIVKPDPQNPFLAYPVNLDQRQAARIQHCTSFANQMAVLETLAWKELVQQPFVDAETAYLRGLMNRQDHPYTGPTFDGWYPSLFYKDYGQLVGDTDSNGSNERTPLVTDVHTAAPDQVDPIGGVLHEGTGNVDLLMIAVDNGPDRMVYAGPVMSHYEFILPGPTLTRLTDSDWQARFPRPPWPTPTQGPPPRPDWTRSYLLPTAAK